MATKKENMKEAQRRIDQAAQEQSTELNLSDLGLTTLPDAIGTLTNLKELDLSHNQFTILPDIISTLTNLQVLNLGYNLLTTIPDTISTLTNLKTLNLNINRFKTLPDNIGNLTNLQELSMGNNKLMNLPESISNLTNLKSLWIYSNQLKSLPDTFFNLPNLQELSLLGNQLMCLPESIGNLTNLDTLWIYRNQLTKLPENLANLPNLVKLWVNDNQITTLPKSFHNLLHDDFNLRLSDNPLDPLLQSAYDGGMDTLRSYLEGIADEEKSEALYEAKLILIGEGGVGKTSLLKVLTGQEPDEEEPTTHGVNVDIRGVNVEHPNVPNQDIHFNAWDFGGQNVYRVTHQFFFSPQAIYILVWEPRKDVQQCQVEDWLNIIRLRVGNKAKVIIVSTHAKTGDRIARIDEPVFLRDYGDLIVGFHEVDSFEKVNGTNERFGIASLKDMIAQAATDLPQMGTDFNRDWREARDEVMALKAPRIPYTKFRKICKEHTLDISTTAMLARSMNDLGYIVYHADDDKLRNDIILKPQWLTKAIGFILEDQTTKDMDGVLPDNRLISVWRDHNIRKEKKYPPKLYNFFLQLMEKYDVSYRLDSQEASLIAQHVPQIRPELPWQTDSPLKKGERVISMVCMMDDAPVGLVPRMIVRAQDYAHESEDSQGVSHRLHWQKGMFLEHNNHGTALLELRDREFHMQIRAAYPPYFGNVLRETLLKLITDTWKGLKYHFAVPCPMPNDDKPCDGRFNIDSLQEFLADGDSTIRCQDCRSKVDIAPLLLGFEVVDRQELLMEIKDKMESSFGGIQKNLAKQNSLIANYVRTMMKAMASESKDGPRLFTIEPVDGKWELTKKKYKLQLWCEAEGCKHPVQDEGVGSYEYTVSADWLQNMAPALNLSAKVLKIAVAMAAPGAGVFMGADALKDLGVESHLDLIKVSTDRWLKGDDNINEDIFHRDGPVSEHERAGIRQLHSFLQKHDPNHKRLGLQKVQTYTGDYQWLCPTHYAEKESKIPTKFE